ncbi:MAG: preprotein translocase subunit SecY [Candidatus Aenigmatarchaeota archaeon]|nr:MAG: preprotein translocase subunit SecY [Candidatus Aenigmarchaeota archaeon]
MAFEESYMRVLERLPGIRDPLKKLSFREKTKYTGMVLFVFLTMSQIMVWGIQEVGLQQLQVFELLLASQFGSLTTLGIGPIVVAAIILQLLVGSKILPWDMTTDKGKMLFQGTQKILTIILCFAEGAIYVMFGAIPPIPGFEIIVILQIAAGGIFILFMDEIISKWGFGSGVSLFILAGVSSGMITRMFNPFAVCTGIGCLSIFQIGGGTALAFPSIEQQNPPLGAIPQIIYYLATADPLNALLFGVLPVVATGLVFMLVVFLQNVKVEIPLAFGSIRGFGRRWPLNFLYTNVIPVILIAALLANVQLMGRLGAQPVEPDSARVCGLLGCFENNNAVSGLVYYLQPPGSQGVAGLAIFMGLFALIGAVTAGYIKKPGWKLAMLMIPVGAVVWFGIVYGLGLTGMIITTTDIARIFVYSGFMIAGATIFSIFWVTTSGMDAGSVSEQIHSTGMQIPGYRRDMRIIERVLNRYIPGLAVLGGIAIGFLASYADLTGAIGSGTGILLATMISYQLYQEITTQHIDDMHPFIKRLLGK